jgi:hypothetical protein
MNWFILPQKGKIMLLITLQWFVAEQIEEEAQAKKHIG